MIACTHHAAFHVWTLGLTEAFATLRLIMITIYKLQGCFFVHKILRVILGSQNALIKVGEVLRLWPAVIAILPSLEPQQLSIISHILASLSLGRGRRHSSVRIDRANISCSISFVCWRESRTTTSIGMEEWCIGIVLAMTSKLICLKSSQVATDPTTFSNK